jgi:hypothetical protein
MYNVYIDRNEQEQRVYVGDIHDLATFKLKSIGGISVDDLERASNGRFNGVITAFPDENYDVPLPPDVPLYLNKVQHHHTPWIFARLHACWAVLLDIMMFSDAVHDGPCVCCDIQEGEVQGPPEVVEGFIESKK